MSLFNSSKPEDPSVRLMIDRYLASGGAVHVVLSTDVRLKPYQRVMDWDSLSGADAGTVIRATRERRAPAPRAYENWPPMEAVITKVGECQSAPGSSRAQRFEILAVGATLGQTREKGLRLSDLTRYLGSGAVEIQVPGDVVLPNLERGDVGTDGPPNHSVQVAVDAPENSETDPEEFEGI